jgi:oligosaccharide repeat unit polymerase
LKDIASLPAIDNTYFCATVLVISLLIIAGMYVALSRQIDNFVNILTPFLLLSVPAYFIFEFIYLFLFNYSGSRFAYLYVYATYTAGVVAKTIGYLAAPSQSVPLLFRLPRIRLRGIAFIFLGLAFALYLPVLIEYADLLTSPREIYALTRSGYGLESFLSTFCIYVGFIFLLFSQNRLRASLAIYLFLSAGLLYLHGSKGQLFYMLLIWLYFSAFVRRQEFGFRRLIALGLVSSSFLFGLFYVTSSQPQKIDLLVSIAGYSSEYTRNAMRVIDDDDLEPQLGRLTFENSYYSFLPRQLFPEKRKDFGSLWLASRYYPGRFQEGRGAPAFGLGVLYADFGIFAILYYSLGEFLSGALLGILAYQLKRRPDAGSFFLFAIFMDVPLIPTGTGFPLIVYYGLANIVKVFGEKWPMQRARSEPNNAD